MLSNSDVKRFCFIWNISRWARVGPVLPVRPSTTTRPWCTTRPCTSSGGWATSRRGATAGNSTSVRDSDTVINMPSRSEKLLWSLDDSGIWFPRETHRYLLHSPERIVGVWQVRTWKIFLVFCLALVRRIEATCLLIPHPRSEQLPLIVKIFLLPTASSREIHTTIEKQLHRIFSTPTFFIYLVPKTTNRDINYLFMISEIFSVSRCWHPVRSKPGPGCLHSHSAVKLHNWMVLFGGEREGQTVNEVWRFHFGEFTNSSIVKFWELVTHITTLLSPERGERGSYTFISQHRLNKWEKQQTCVSSIIAINWMPENIS